MNINLPPNFVRNIAAFGPVGVQWLESLPALLDDCARLWDLMRLTAYSNLTYNYVASALRADGSGAVLKLGPPMGDPRDEREALRAYDGRGAVRLLEADDERGAMLLERLTPGRTLVELADEIHDGEATSIAADVMRRLRRSPPAGHDFPTVAQWGEGLQRLRARFDGGSGPFPAALVAEAEGLFSDLLVSSDAPILLHGDLHHDNILSSGETWLAIDPKGLVGDPAYETGALLRNLWPDRSRIADPSRLLERRTHQLADALGFDRARVRGWAVAQAVLSAWWSMEDGGDDWETTIGLADLLKAIKI